MVLAQQQQSRGQLFGLERQHLRRKQSDLLFLQSALALVSVVGLLMPIVDPSESPQVKWFSRFASGASAAALFLISSSSHAQQLDRLADALEGGEKEALKTHMGVRLAHAQQIAAMNGREQLAWDIISTKPMHTWMSHAQRAGVADLLPPPPAPPPMEPMPDTIEVKSRALTLAEMEAINKGDYDMSWFNMGFLYFPAVIVGAPGTGKSYTIRYRTAELLRMYPNSTVIVIDDHDDPTSPNAWNKFIDGIEVISDDPNRAWKALTTLKKELDNRKKAKKHFDWRDRETPLIRIVWEEFQDSILELTESQQKKAYELIKSINGRQGRKYGIGIDLCYHDFSVTESGFNMQTLNAMGWLLLDSTITNPNLKMPRNFEMDTLVKDWMLEAGTLAKNEARAHIFKRADGDESASNGFKPEVVVFPRRNIPKIIINREPLTLDIEPQVSDLTAFKPLDKLQPDQYEFYDQYLKSADWQRKKLDVKARDSDKCRACGATENLEVHHLTYERLGNERLEDLVLLCKEDHNAVHKL